MVEGEQDARRREQVRKVEAAALMAASHALEVTELALAADDTDALRSALIERFEFDRVQADAVIDMQFWHLTKARRQIQAGRVARLSDAKSSDGEIDH